MKNKKRKTINEIRNEGSNTIEGLMNGTVSIEEANNIAGKAAEKIASFNADLDGVVKKIKDGKSKQSKQSDIIDVKALSDTSVLTKEHMELASSIKAKLRKTAQTIIDIGEELTKATKSMKKEYKELFYKEVGMSKRSALRYQQIANSQKIIELKEKNELEGKTMTDLMQLISTPKNTPINKDAQTVAQGFFAKYKSEPDKIKDIIEELQKLLANEESNGVEE